MEIILQFFKTVLKGITSIVGKPYCLLTLNDNIIEEYKNGR